MGRRLKHTFGTDPEFFIYQDLVETEYGNIPDIIPPAALIEDFGFESEDIKDKKVLYKGEGFQWSEDGAAIEMQTIPHKSIKSFNSQIMFGINQLTTFLRPHKLKLWKNPLGYFDTEKYWENRGEEFRMCVIFGCDPDQYPDKYVELGLENPDDVGEIDVSKHPYRYCGAHVHIQAPKSKSTIFFGNWDKAAILFDFFVGTLNTTFLRNVSQIDAEKARLIHYGKPGRIRLQAYNPEEDIFGIEYRVMSNAWLGKLQNTSQILHTMDLVAQIIEKNMADKFIEDNEALIPDVYNSIVNLDGKQASNILAKSVAWALTNNFCTVEDLKAFGILNSKKEWWE